MIVRSYESMNRVNRFYFVVPIRKNRYNHTGQFCPLRYYGDGSEAPYFFMQQISNKIVQNTTRKEFSPCMKSKKTFLKVIIFLLCITLCLPLSISAKEKQKYSTKEIEKIIEGIIQWKKQQVHNTTNGYLLRDSYLDSVGTTQGDWYPFALGRYHYKDSYKSYLAVAQNIIEQKYQTAAKLHAVKATEWHRMSFAILAMGGNPASFGRTTDGKEINLIADGTYNRGFTTSLGRQGLNGWIFGLLALDTKQYKVPSSSHDTRESILKEILQQQLADGGFALSGSTADPDMTAMALQALAPYYSSEKTYTYTQKFSQKQVTRTVRSVVEDALQVLSNLQTKDGDFCSWGTQNAESTAQVLVALCSLGISPQTDCRFIKKNHSLLDGILKYQERDGGFIHSKTYHKDNPSAKPNVSNSMASEQVLYALISYERFEKNKRNLYDCRKEWSQDLGKKISHLRTQIDTLPKKITLKHKNKLQQLKKSYLSIPKEDRFYIFNYYKLENAWKKVTKISVKQQTLPKATAAPKAPSAAVSDKKKTPLKNKNNKDKRAVTATQKPNTMDFSSTASPAAIDSSLDTLPYLAAPNEIKHYVSSLPSSFTTKEYNTVLALLYQMENSEDFTNKNFLFHQLQAAKMEIEGIQKEIDSLNIEIKKNIYPFEHISLQDKKDITSLYHRYQALRTYDQSKIINAEDLIRAKTLLDNFERTRLICILLLVFILLLSFFLIKSFQKRRKKKRMLQMLDLSDAEQIISDDKLI